MLKLTMSYSWQEWNIEFAHPIPLAVHPAEDPMCFILLYMKGHRWTN